MGQNQVMMVRIWSGISCMFAMVYASMSLWSGKNPAMPAYLGYLWVGILGGLVASTLTFQQRRISDLEQKLSKRS